MVNFHKHIWNSSNSTAKTYTDRKAFLLAMFARRPRLEKKKQTNKIIKLKTAGI